MSVEKFSHNPSTAFQSLSSLKKKALRYLPKNEVALIQKAFNFSEKAHKNQFRKSGEPFIEHPLNVAHILVDLHMGVAPIVTGLLHDVVEDTSVSLEEIEKNFGSTISFLVDGMTKLSQIQFTSRYQKESENLRKMIVSIGQDVRVIIIKLADRLHNMKTLQSLPEKRQLRISQETLNIYAPIAGRLGLNSIKVELEDLAFKYIYPEVYSSIFQKFEKEKPQREKYIKDVIQFLTNDLAKKTNIKFEITGRTKNMYSIYKKMQIQEVDYHQVYDIIAFRICTQKVRECYEILGWVHSLWKPISDRFKDFIAIPKANNYQSLHTTVIGPEGKQIEIQIRTYEMHQIAEKGIANHWKYKEESFFKNVSINQDTLEQFSWLQELVYLHQQSNNGASDFLENVKGELFESSIYVFTPKGDVKEFSEGATPVDFAFAIHTDIGNKLNGAKVNGQIVPLKYKLKNGDVVEVITSAKSAPSREWLNYCVSAKARSKIKQSVNEKERILSINMGSKILEKDLRKVNLTIEKLLEKPDCKKVMKNLGLNSKDDIFSQIGYGKITSKYFIRKILGEKFESETMPYTLKKRSKKSSSPILVEGMGSVDVALARCCNPLPGEDIMGYISMERGIVIHHCECKKLLSLDSERFVHVDWRSTLGDFKHSVSLKVLIHDTPGVLKEISDVFVANGVNILKITAQTNIGTKAICLVNIEVKDIDHLRSITRALQQLKNIYSVSRIHTSI